MHIYIVTSNLNNFKEYIPYYVWIDDTLFSIYSLFLTTATSQLQKTTPTQKKQQQQPKEKCVS